MVRRTRTRGLAALAAVSLVLAACGGDDDDTGAEQSDAGTEEATGSTEQMSEESTDMSEEATGDMSEESTGDMSEESTGEVAPPSGEPIKIGLLTSLTTNFAPWGLQTRDGMLLAIEEINASGGVDGRPLELVEADDENDGDAGLAGFERLAEEGVVGIGGLISSTVGLAVSNTAEELEMPTFLVKAGAAEILTRDSRYVFRTCLPAAPMVSGPIAQYAVSEGLTKVGAIIADYGWGQSIKAALESDFDALPDVELQVEVAPVTETDFTTYLRNLEDFGPELIVATGHPPGSGPITVQSEDLGIDVPITGAYSPWALVSNGAGEAAIGRYADFDCADYQSADYQDLAKRFLAMSDEVFMDDDAVANVGDDPVAVAEYLHGQSYDLPGYPFTMEWTEWGELAQAQPLFSVMSEGPAPEGVNEAGTWYPETLLLPDPLTPYEPG
jgi:branched-chain amino acid transport system substrate-binding protein